MRLTYFDDNIPSNTLYDSSGSETLRIAKKTRELINLVKERAQCTLMHLV